MGLAGFVLDSALQSTTQDRLPSESLANALRSTSTETLLTAASTVSRWDRLLVFGGLNLAAIALFVVCFTLLPILSLRPRKFAILYVSLSSLVLLHLCFVACRSQTLPA